MTVKLIKIFKNKVVKNKKGNLVKFISTKDKFFKKFGEIYFNEIKYEKQKGWIKHSKNTCLIQCVTGEVKFHLIDNKNKEKYYILKSNTGHVLKIPPGIWFSFTSLKQKSVVANMINNYHRDAESIKSKKIKKYLII